LREEFTFLRKMNEFNFMTKYLVGSLDQSVYLEDFAVPRLANRSRGVFTPFEYAARRFESMTSAQLALFTLETDDPCAVALNLIVIPVGTAGASHPAQLELL
jgi:hypothetical protein